MSRKTRRTNTQGSSQASTETHDGRPIPEWAREGWIERRWGPPDARSDARSDASVGRRALDRIDLRTSAADGWITILHTGPGNGPGDDEDAGEDGPDVVVPCDQFPLADGFRALADLDRRGGPLFDPPSPAPDDVEGRRRFVASLTFAPAFLEHDVRFLRFVWSVEPHDRDLIDLLPIAWWRSWFEACPSLVRPDLAAARALRAFGSRAHVDSIRTSLLAANPNADTDWDAGSGIDVRTVALGPLLEDQARRADWYGGPVAAGERGPTSGSVDRLRNAVRRERGDLIHRTYAIRRYAGFVDELENRIVRLEVLAAGSESTLPREPWDAESLLLASHFLPPPRTEVVSAEVVLDWIRVAAGPPPTWWDVRPAYAPAVRMPRLVERLLGFWVVQDTEVLGPDGPLAGIDRLSWSTFGATSLVWLLDGRVDGVLRTFATMGDRASAVGRLATELISLLAGSGDEDAEAYRTLRSMLPQPDPDAAVPVERLGELASRLGVDPTASVEDLLAASPAVANAFADLFGPTGLRSEAVSKSPALRHLLIRHALKGDDRC